jgi:hypothetical protein
VKRWLLVLAACGGTQPTPRPPRAMNADEWVRRCADYLEVARLALARVDPAFGEGKLALDNSPFHPSLRFDVAIEGGEYRTSVERGRHPCIDFDSDDPSWINLPWSDGRTPRFRIRRIDGNEAWLDTDPKAPDTTAVVFRREMEHALERCLVDARGVKLADPPKDFSCADTVDECPDEPGSGEDGCP